MTVESAATAELGLGNGTRHLIHCPPSWDHYLLDAPSSGEEHFVLAGEMPVAHPLFNDGSGHFHDFQVTTETIREIGEFVGHRYFGVPKDRPGLFYRFDLDLTEPRAWRVGVERSHMTTNIRARPANVVNGVPRGLEFFVNVRIDDVPCATASASLVFLMPMLHRNHMAHSRQAMRAVPELNDAPDGPVWPVEPEEVGRGAAENVVVSRPAESSHGRLSTWVVPRPGNPLFAADKGGHAPGMLLLESLRQTSLLTAGRAFGLNPTRATLGASEVRFRGYAEADLPLRCAAVPGPLERDADGRPAVPVTLTVTQHRRAVAEAVVTVVQDF
jgi:2-oxo-3-(phosphooxy)propyl 3-oxoalkanoate synthase